MVYKRMILRDMEKLGYRRKSHVSDCFTFLCGQFYALLASRTIQKPPRVIISTEAELISLFLWLQGSNEDRSWILIMPNYSSTRYTFTSHYNNKRIKDLGKFHQIIEVCYNILWNTYPGMFSDIVVTIGRSLTRAYCYGSRPKSSYNVCYTFHNQCQKWCMVEDDVIYRSQIILATLALEIERAQERHRKIFWHNEISGSRQVVQRIVVKINISFDQRKQS